MTFQIRAFPPEGMNNVVGREVARKLEDAAQTILGGGTADALQYAAAVARYTVLLELMQFMEDEAKKLQAGELIEDD